MDNSQISRVEEKKSPDNNIPEKKKKKFKIPSSLVIIFSILLFVIFLSWCLQGLTVDYEDPDNGVITKTVTAVGLFSLGNVLIEGFESSIDVILYLFVLGWFLEILLRTRTLEEGVKSLMRGLNGKEIVLVPLLFCVFCFAGTAFGMQEETLALFIIIIPFFIIAGFDKMTGLLVILLGTCTGLAASVVDPFSVATAFDAIPTVVGNYSISDGIWLRFFALIVFTTIGCIFVTTYAYRVKKNNSNSIVAEDMEDDLQWALETFEYEEVLKEKISKQQRTGLIVFISVFVLMFLMLVPWSFIPGPDEVTYGPGTSWLFNGFALPGHWGFGELIVMFIISSLILGLVFKMSVSEQTDALYKGAKDMLVVCLLIGVARAIPAALARSSLDYFFAISIANSLKSVSALGWTYIVFFIFLVFAIFIPSTTGLANAVIGIFTGSAYQMFGADPEVAYQAIVATIFAYVVAVGLMNMITPTQAVVLASAERSRVSYVKMLKPVGIYMGIIMVVALAIMFPLTMLL